MPDPIGYAGATAYEVASARFGGPTRSIERDLTVTTTPSRLLDNNPRRVAWLIQNLGAVDCYNSDRRDVTSVTGFILAASGGVNAMDVLEDGESVAYDRYVLCASGTCALHILEIIRV